MEFIIERQVELPHVCVEVATVQWFDVTETPVYTCYKLSQRLSDDHPPLRVGKLTTPHTFPRTRSVVFLPPGYSARLFPIEKPLRLLHCDFNREFFEDITQRNLESWQKHLTALLAMRNQRMEFLMQKLYAELDQPGFGQNMVIEAVCKLMLVELARHAQQLDIAAAKDQVSSALAPWQLSRIQERVAVSLELGYPNLEELAKLCGISQGHLSRSFKQATGRHIHKFIAEERIQAAMRLLSDDHLSCKDVAERLGFKSSAYFSTAFQRLTGKTPSEFKQQAVNQDLEVRMELEHRFM